MVESKKESAIRESRKYGEREGEIENEKFSVFFI